MIGQWNWAKNDENMPVVPMLIKDGNDDRFSQLCQGGSAGQILPGSGLLWTFVRNVGTGPEAPDKQIGGIMADQENRQKSDGNPPAAPTFIRDGSSGRIYQLSQEGSADQLAAWKRCL